MDGGRKFMVIENQVAAPEVTAAPKVEVKGSEIFVNGAKMVLESDLIAAKKGLEGRLNETTSTHQAVLSQTQMALTATQQEAATLKVELEKIKAAPPQVGASSQELAKYQAEAASAKTRVEQAEKQALDLRIKLIAKSYGIAETDPKLAGKSPVQLDALEDALKIVSAGKGPGGYAVGAGAGGASAEMRSKDRIRSGFDMLHPGNK
jgi:hypothetical protein